jgi:hypothetical protein
MLLPLVLMMPPPPPPPPPLLLYMLAAEPPRRDKEKDQVLPAFYADHYWEGELPVEAKT